MQIIFLAPPFTTEAELRKCIHTFEKDAQGYHFDFMDGNFVSTKQMNIELINTVRTLTDVPFWIHLMARAPHELIDYLELNPGDTVSFHYEVFHKKSGLEDLAEKLEHKNLRPSLAINPQTSIEKISHLLHAIEHLVVMSVKPGAPGRPFIPHTFAKLEELQMYCLAQEFDLIVAVDGGVHKTNIAQLAQAGVQEVAVTSAIFNTSNPLESLQELSALFSTSSL